ncbi:MAG: YbaB/EbfC family nucleoid-associated protein [Cytophagales bacterium]
MFSILGKVKEAQEKMKNAQKAIVNITLTAESGGGMVKATVNGHKNVLKIEVDPEIGNDFELMQDLIVAAVNKALNDIDVLVKEELAKSIDGVIPNIPGLDLKGLMSGMR